MNSNILKFTEIFDAMMQIKLIILILLSAKYVNSLEYCSTNITCTAESKDCSYNNFCCEKNELATRLHCLQRCSKNNLCCAENFCCVSASLIGGVKYKEWNRVIYMLAILFLLCTIAYFYYVKLKRRDAFSRNVQLYSERENLRTLSLRVLPPSYQQSQKVYMIRETRV